MRHVACLLSILFVCLAVGAAGGEEEAVMPRILKSIEGLAPYQVYQRDSKGQARIAFRGALAKPIEGKIEARITKGKSVILDWKAVGKASGEGFAGEITGVPTGGEYTAELRFPGGSTCSVGHLMVGDLWLLGGQSNMDGYGKLTDVETPSPMVHCFYMDDRWGIARDPITWLNAAADPVHWGCSAEERPAVIERERYSRTTGASLGVRFGKEMVKHTGVPVALIPCSHGGTSMDQWSPALKNEGGKSLYGAMLRRANALGGKVAGILWYQGESDTAPQAAPAYTEKMRRFVEALRQDLGQPDLPFILAQIGIYYNQPTYEVSWDSIRWQQLGLEKEIKNLAVASTMDCGLSDWIHLDGLGQRKLGARMAVLARILRFKEKGLEVGPRPAEFTLDSARQTLTIRFKGVNGSLKKVSPVFGFEVDSGGAALVDRSRAEGNKVVLHFVSPLGPKATLWYGRGFNPAVNLIDAAGMACPAFGPVEIR